MNVDLSVPVGARLLLVSEPEGAASVLLRVLAGLARPSAGEYQLAGMRRADASGQGWARRVAYVGPTPTMYRWLTPREVLLLSARLTGLETDEASQRVDALLAQFRLVAEADRPLGRTGSVVTQKTALAAALVSDPEILLLDDPLRSVEPGERSRLLRLRGRRTVLLASRYPAGEAGLVNQVALLCDGRVVLHAAVADLEAHGLPLSVRGIKALGELAPRTRVAATA